MKPQIDFSRRALVPRSKVPALAAAATIVLLAGVALSLLVGDVVIPTGTVLDGLFRYDSENVQQVIVRDWRLPRAAADILVGAALAVAGAIMQVVTRNPLASPGILGLNTGASFAGVLALVLWPAANRVELMVISIAGATLAAALVFALGAVSRGGRTPVRLALIGLAVSALFAAVGDGVLIYNEMGHDALLWSSRGNENVQWADVALFFPVVVTGLLGAIAMAPNLGVLSLGEQVARGLGQRSHTTRFFASIVVLMLAGGAVAVAGPIGFVGLIVPHVVRALVGMDYRLVIPGSALAGAILLLAANIGAHWATAPLRTPVPVGVVTSILGVPCFLYLACRRQTVPRGGQR